MVNGSGETVDEGDEERSNLSPTQPTPLSGTMMERLDGRTVEVERETA